MDIADITNDRLLTALQLSNFQQSISPSLAEMLLVMCRFRALKPGFVSLTYQEPMIHYAWQCACMAYNNFDMIKSDNPFSYFMTLITVCFNQYITTKKCSENTDVAQLASTVIDIPIYPDMVKEYVNTN